MQEVVLVIHLILACAIIGLVLLQRSEGGGLGIGSGGGMGAFASAQTTASVLSRATAVCATGFFITSLILGILAGQHSKRTSILDQLDQPAATAPANAGKAIGDQPSNDPSAPPIVPGKIEKAPAPAKAEVPAKAPEKSKPAAPIAK
jgi:preprotein translocase subunit SecG